MMIDNRVTFEEMYTNHMACTTTLYFNAPKDLFPAKYSDADYITISVEFPERLIESRYATVMYSPTAEGLDYDWNDWDIPYEDIEKLMSIADIALKGETT